MSDRRLNEDDLAPWARRLFEQAFQNRERPKHSREDFAAAYIAALLDLSSWSSFRAGKPE